MEEPTNGSNGESLAVELSIEIEASPETVWAIVTTPGGMSAWLQGTVTFETDPGSPFRADFPDFGTVIAGEIVAFDLGARRIALTWGVEAGPQAANFPAGSSLLELQVQPAPGGCRVDLRHSAFPSAHAAREHEDGWRFHLGRLSLNANRTDLAAALERTLAAWFTAWNDPDGKARLETLRGCCADDIEFRDEWAMAHGIERLNLHITNCHRYMPSWRIEATGDVRVCRGEALVGWRSGGPEGTTTEGFNHVRATADGIIRRVVGFERQPGSSS